MNRRNLLPLLTVALLLAPAASPNRAAAQNSPPAAPQAVDLSSPEAAVRSFAAAVNALSVEGANCLVGGKIDQDLRSWADEARKSGEVLELTVASVQLQVTGDTATAAVSFDVKAHGQQQHFAETLSLRKQGADWKIVPPTEEELAAFSKPGAKDPHLLALLGAVYTHPKLFGNARESAREAVCRSNLKQLALAALMYSQDSDDRLPRRADSWKAPLRPYVKSEEVFHCPSDASGPVAYSFNPQLQGKKLASIRKPGLTVLFYEGKKGVLNFRHNGRAIVALANGSVKPVTPAEARALRWAP